jgi:hypothetical protein
MTLTWFWTLRTDAISLIRAIAPVAVAGMRANTVIETLELRARRAAVVRESPLPDWCRWCSALPTGRRSAHLGPDS